MTLSADLSRIQTELADAQASVQSETSQSRRNVDELRQRSTELETELQAAQSTAQNLEAEKHAVVAEHASALEALRQEHSEVVTQHESAHEQLRTEHASSQSRVEALAVKAGEHPELIEQIASLQEQIATESAAALSHQASCRQLQEELDGTRAATEAVQSVATASALETSQLSDKVVSLEGQLADERETSMQRESECSHLSAKIAKAQEGLATVTQEQEMAAEHHRVKLAALERTHSEAVLKLIAEHEKDLSGKLESQASEWKDQTSTAREAAERASESEEALSQRAKIAEEESRQQATEVARLLVELDAAKAECLTTKAAADTANSIMEQAEGALAAKAAEHKQLLDASNVAAQDGAALESAMSTLSERVSTDAALRVAAEQEAAERLAALQDAQSEVAELQAQAELMAAEREELVEEHKLALGAAELDVEEAEKASAQAQVQLETVQTEHTEAVEVGAKHESTVFELREQLQSAEASRAAVEEEARAHLESATSATRVRIDNSRAYCLALRAHHQVLASNCASCLQAHSDLQERMNALETEHHQHLESTSSHAASSVAAAISEAQAAEEATVAALRSEMAEMERRMAGEVADVARQAAERVTAAERRLQQSLAATAAANAEASELKKVLATMSGAGQTSRTVVGTPPAQRGPRKNAGSAGNGNGKPSPPGAMPVTDADDSLVKTQAKLAVSEEALKKARLEARVSFCARCGLASLFRSVDEVAECCPAMCWQALRTKLIGLRTEGEPDSIGLSGSSFGAGR